MCIPKDKEIPVVVEALDIGYRAKGMQKIVARNIRAQLRKGEMTCLIGANGAGKSTLLRTLSAFQPALNGHIRIMGKDIGAYSARDLSQIISVVLTERCDAQNLTVTEVVEMGRSPYTGFWGSLNRADNRAVIDAMDKTGIAGLAKRMVHTLSDGELQKVMIAKALAQETPIILLDEPTAFLDFPSKVELMNLLRDLAHGCGKTIFLSTHDLNLAMEIADKMWIMHPEDGQGIAVGTPEDLILNGSLPHLFANNSIVFDGTMGLFRVKCPYRDSICLKGDGTYRDMMGKALERNGIKPVEQQTGLCIEASDGEYKLMQDDAVIATVSTVEKMLHLLQASKPQPV